MIRHHVAQDQLSADAISIYPVMGMTAIAQTAAVPVHVTLQDGGRENHAATWNHPLSFYAAPASTLLLLVVSIVAMLELLRVRRRALGAPAHSHAALIRGNLGR